MKSEKGGSSGDLGRFRSADLEHYLFDLFLSGSQFSSHGTILVRRLLSVTYHQGRKMVARGADIIRGQEFWTQVHSVDQQAGFYVYTEPLLL